MNKNSFFVHSGLIRFALIQSSAVSLILLAVALLAGIEWWLTLLIFAHFFAFMLAMHFIPYRNAFGRVTVDEDGMQNKHLRLSWEEIDEIGSFAVHPVVILKHKFVIPPIHLSHAVSIGKETKSDFVKESDRTAILFSLNKKTVAALEKYGKERSRVIRDVLLRYDPSSERFG